MPLKDTLHKARRRITDLFFEGVAAGRRRQRVAVYLLRLGVHMVRELGRDNCLQRAAALSFTTILSLVPVTALFVLYFKMAGKLDVVSGNFQEWILRLFVAEAAQGVTQYIDQFVESLHTRALGTIGAIGMMFVAYSLFRTVEKSLNGIWAVSSHRKFMARFQILCSLLVVVPTLLIVSLYISGKVQGLKVFGDYTQIPWLARSMYTAVPLTLTAISLFALFKLVPNTTVRWRPAIMAALIAAALFEGAKGGFNLYVARVIPYSKIYGTLGLFPIMMLWIYLSWIIVLFGVELSYTIQNLRSLHDAELQRREDQPRSMEVHEEWGLRIFTAFLKRFQKQGGPVNLEDISTEIPLTSSQIQKHLEHLCNANILGFIDQDEGEGYVPTRPLEKVTIAEIEDVFRKMLGLPPSDHANREKVVSTLLT